MSQEPSEFELQSYVDGRLEPAARARLERYLAERPQLAARLHEQREVSERLRQALAGLGGAAGTERSPGLPALRRQSRHRPRLMHAAAALAWFVVGATTAWLGAGVAPDRHPLPMADAIAAHAVFTADQRHPVELRIDASRQLQDWLSQRIGRPIPLPELAPLGFRFMGGRLLASEYGPAALLMYDDDRGTRLTVYVRQDQGGREPGLHSVSRDGVDVRYWYGEGYAYAVSSPIGYAELDRATARVRSALTG